VTTRSPRERMVFSAAQLIRRQGVTATGVRDVVAHAGAPRGSVQHYFPDGKTQLVGEAVDWSGRYAASRIDRFMAGMRPPTPGKLFAAMVGQWIDEYRRDGFAAGCPLAAATIDCADTDPLVRARISAALDRWRDPITAALATMGVPTAKTRSVATLMLCTLEGAIVLSRAEQSTQPLTTVARELAPHLDSYLGR
jgi:AcrR family transcriptional regulator